MKVRVRISFTDGSGEPFMGIGLLWLLRRIEKLGSIRMAAADMGMSYVKALRIINRLEKNLKRKMLLRRMGGMERGGATLTPFAEEFLKKYERCHERADQFTRKEFSKLFGTSRR